MRFINKLHPKRKPDAIKAHFRLLGLKRGECRTHVIRSAAQAKSIELSLYEHIESLDRLPEWLDVDRAKIAVAAYRLLDPRERNDIYERVQLCYPIDRDDMMPVTDFANKLVDQMPNVQPKKIRSGTTVKLMGQPVLKDAIDGKTPAADEPEPSRTLAQLQINSDPTLEERRSLVRMMREASASSESSLRSLSPLGWIRSRLGL
jgi:hypothetical protein